MTRNISRSPAARTLPTRTVAAARWAGSRHCSWQAPEKHNVGGKDLLHYITAKWRGLVIPGSSLSPGVTILVTFPGNSAEWSRERERAATRGGLVCRKQFLPSKCFLSPSTQQAAGAEHPCPTATTGTGAG